jgi:hypothetical protein
MVISPLGPGTKNYCAGEGQQQFSSQAVSCGLVSWELAAAVSVCWELQLWEIWTCSWGQGQFRNQEEGECLPLEAATKQRLLKNEKALCVL